MLSEPKLGKKERPRKGTTKKSFSNRTSAFTFFSFFFFFFWNYICLIRFWKWHKSLYSNEKWLFADACAKSNIRDSKYKLTLIFFEHLFRFVPFWKQTAHCVDETLWIFVLNCQTYSSSRENYKHIFLLDVFCSRYHSCLERSFVNWKLIVFTTP